MSVHIDHVHHRPTVWRDRSTWWIEPTVPLWRTGCKCGWMHFAQIQHAAFVAALAHAEGSLR